MTGPFRFICSGICLRLSKLVFYVVYSIGYSCDVACILVRNLYTEYALELHKKLYGIE